MDGLLGDLKGGFRMLVRTPLLSTAAVLTIGLGIGGVTFAFSVLYGALLRPLPVQSPDRLVSVFATRPAQDADRLSIDLHDYLEIRRDQTSFEALAASYGGTINVAGEEGPPERYQGTFVTVGMLSMLGVPPLHGRTFREGEDAPGVPPVVVLSHDVWRTRYAEDPGAVGRSVRLNGETATIVGVMPPGFRFPFNQDLWVPLRDDPATTPRRTRFLQVYGYLREGVSEAAATAEIDAIAQRIATREPETNRGMGALVLSFQKANNPPQIVLMLTMMMVMVAGVLLVACANVTNVLMARAVARSRDVAIRSAMGAQRWQVVRQLLTEAVALGAMGGLVGLAVAFVALRIFNGAVPEEGRPYWIVFSLDTPALLFTMAVTLVAAVAAGTAPALRASGGGAGSILRDESRGSSGLRMGRLSGLLVTAELAVSCGLMIAAGLLVQSLLDLNRVDLGFDADAVMTARLGLFETDYPDAEARSQFYGQLVERLSAEPGIRAAALTSSLPAAGGPRWSFEIDGEAYAAEADRPAARGTVVTHGFFETFGVRFLEGRDFTRAESERGGDPVAVVNQTFADQFLGGRALGRFIRLHGNADGPWLQVVGVVADVHEGVSGFGGDDTLREGVYVPLGTEDPRFISVAVRAAGPASGLAPTLRAVVGDLDRNLPLYWVQTMREVLDQTTLFHRIFSTMFAIFGGTALFLAAVGLYGVIDFSVSARVREMGIRMAMGAEGADVLRLVMGRVFLQLGVGVALGLAMGALLSVPLASVLFGMKTWDGGVYVVIVGTLFVTGTVAALGPALRAVRVDPVVALSA
jgi:putative ABC transport system permease protein